MTQFILLALFCVIPDCNLLREHVDVIEVNHVYKYCEETERYDFVLTQFLFLNWDTEHGTHVIEAWRMRNLDNDSPPRSLPEYDHLRRRWEVRFDNRVITAQAFRETSADFDWEERSREKLPVGRRKNLRSPPSR